MNIPGLRSPHAKVGGIFYFGRMIDKIRLHEAGKLPDDYVPNLGGGFDERCVHFLRIDYAKVVERVKQGGGDDEVLAWCFQNGRKPNDEEIEIWNEFMRKRGWNDEAAARLAQRKAEGNFSDREDIKSFFDFIDADEDRKPGGAG
jgi:gluconokinase